MAKPLKVAIMHFHLRTGGVTSVIRHQIDALGPNQVLLVTGEMPAHPLSAPVVCVPDIAYDTDRTDWPSPDRIADRIQDTIADYWPEGCDLLHVHNPTLGKNRDLASVLSILSQRGVRLFLQIHDLAEDGRPHLYSNAPYPADCHYGVINRNDYQHLQNAGLNPEGLHLIENTVVPLPTTGAAPASTPYVLYPIRAIRRKNIGEALLLATFLTDPLWITLPPSSRVDQIPYNKWKKVAKTLALPAVFEAGVHRAFPDVIAGARSMVSTSVAEGFGFALLEPWTAGRFLWGRSVPGVVDGFLDAGVDLDHLYPHLTVSLDWFDTVAFQKRWHQTAASAGQAFGRPLSEASQAAAYEHLTSGGTIDFAILDESAQMQVIESRCRSQSVAETLRAMNPILHHPGEYPDGAERIAHNQRVIKEKYHPGKYATTLHTIYQSVARRQVHHRINKECLLSSYFRPESLSLLKWSPHDP